MGTAQDARPVSDHLRKDFLVDFGHPGPVGLRVPMVFLMKAVIEKHQVVKAMVRADRVGEIIPRLSAVVQEIGVSINENPAQII